MPLDRPLALAAGGLGVVAGVLAAVGQFLPALLGASGPEQVGGPTLVLSAATVLVSPVLVLVLGYRAGTRRDLAREYGTVALSFAVGGAGGYVPGYAVTVLAVPVDGVGEFVLLLAGSAVYSALVKGGWFAVAGLAGAAVGHFRAGGAGPGSHAGPT